MTWLLAGLLLVAVALAIRLHWTRHPKAPESQTEKLHGDFDDSTGAMSDLLSKTPESQRLPLLLKDVQDVSPGLRYAAVDALGEIQTPAAVDAIERSFTDSSSVVRQRAMEVLQKVDRERGLRLLLVGLSDEDEWVREAAITQLVVFFQQDHKNYQHAVPSLIKALDDPDPVLPLTSMNLLHKLTGQPWHIRHDTSAVDKQKAIQHWKGWWAETRPHWEIPAGYDDIAAICPQRTDPAPAFDVQDLDGNPINLTTQRGKVTLLNFWGTWCPPCQVETPDLVQLDSAYRSRGLDIVGIALGEDGASQLRSWCQAHHVAYRQVLSTDEIQAAYGHIEEVPVSVLLDKQGRIRYRWDGERDFATFSAAVGRLVQE
jgi:peroxiredoxin